MFCVAPFCRLLLASILVSFTAAQSGNDAIPTPKPKTKLSTTILYASRAVLRQSLPSKIWSSIDWWSGSYARKGDFYYYNVTETDSYFMDPRIVLKPSANSREVLPALYEASYYYYAVCLATHLDYKLMDSIGSYTGGLSLETPIISLVPLHNWEEEGYKTPYILIPHFGQSFKGRVALELIKAGQLQKNAVLQKVMIFRESLESSSLLTFHEGEASLFSGLPIVDVFVSLDVLEKVVSDIAGETPFPDVLIVDCSLELFEKLARLLVRRGVLSDSSCVVLFHDYQEVNLWSGLTVLQEVNATVYVFGQCRPEWNSCTFNGSLTENGTAAVSREYDPTDFYEALFHDVAEFVTEAGEISQYDPSNTSIFDVPVSWVCRQWESSRPVGPFYYFLVQRYNQFYYYYLYYHGRPHFPFWYKEEGDKILSALQRHCFNGKMGSLAFSEQTLQGCLNKSAIALLPLRLTDVYQNVNESQIRSRWRIDGKWTMSNGLDLAPNVLVLPLQADAVEKRTNKTLRVIGSYDPLFFYIDPEGTAKGVDVELVNFIAETLDFTGVEYTAWNGTSWTMLKALAKSEEWDMAIGAVVASVNAEKIVNLTRFYHTSRLQMVSLSEQVDAWEYAWNFMDPFKWSVWLVILGMIFVSTFVVKWLGLVKEFSDGMWLSFAVIYFMNENRLVVMKNPFGRLFISVLLFVVLVLISSYTANMISFLTADASGGTSDVSLLAFRNRPVSALQHSDELLRLQTSGLRNIVPVTSDEEAASLLFNNSVDAYVADSHLVDRLTRTYCNLTVIQSKLYTRQFSLAAKHQFFVAHGEGVNEAIAKAVFNEKVVDWLHSHLMARLSEHLASDCASDLTEKPLGILNLGGVFVIAGGAAALCVCAKGLVLLTKRSKRVKPS
ncbi:uncharacterized protein [Oscarella lobularis]|uniref:uncharacterized protein n=1 Tax=Oscarella lobularis TaxID=121494 RepID=UPI003314279B